LLQWTRNPPAPTAWRLLATELCVRQKIIMTPIAQNFIAECIRLLLQLIIFGIVGGGVSWYYTRLQKRRELRRDLLKDFSSLYGRFLSLRYRFNSFHIKWSRFRSPNNHPLTEDERRLERWKHYEEACTLLGEFQGIRPLITSQYPELVDDINFIYSKYQDWRRRIGAGKPVLQEIDGKSEDSFKELRDRYGYVVHIMRKKL